MTDLTDLLVEQSTTITSIKRVLTNFKKIGRANVTLYIAKNRLDGLENLWQKCQRLNVQLLQTATIEEQRSIKYFASEEFYAAEDVYHEAADHLANVIGGLSSDSSGVAVSASDTSIRDSFGNVPLQLPRISLPKFSGNFTEWENFRGLFESLVATKESLSNTAKLHYLKTSVTGEAALLLNNIQVTDSNYDGAWKLLVEEDRKSVV